MTRLYGLPVPVAVEYDDFTVDIAENQLLLMAAMRLIDGSKDQRTGSSPTAAAAPHPGGGVGAAAEVPRCRTWRRTPPQRPIRLCAAHSPQIVLAAESFEHRLGDLRVTGYMFDMWRVFEDFVTIALREALQSFGGQSVARSRCTWTGENESTCGPTCCGTATVMGCRPWLTPSTRPKGPKDFPNADIYQMLAYCTVLGLRKGIWCTPRETKKAESTPCRRLVSRFIAGHLILGWSRLLC